MENREPIELAETSDGFCQSILTSDKSVCPPHSESPLPFNALMNALVPYPFLNGTKKGYPKEPRIWCDI